MKTKHPFYQERLDGYMKTIETAIRVYSYEFSPNIMSTEEREQKVAHMLSLLKKIIEDRDRYLEAFTKEGVQDEMRTV